MKFFKEARNKTIYEENKNILYSWYKEYYEEYKYITVPDNLTEKKKEETVNILNNKLTLNNNDRLFITLYMSFLNGISKCLEDMELYDCSYTTNRKTFDYQKAYKRIHMFSFEMLKIFVDNVNEDLGQRMLSFAESYSNLVMDYLQRWKEIDTYFTEQVRYTTDNLRDRTNSINAKAIGREAGLLYASDSLFMSSVGTYANKASFENETSQAFSSFNTSLDNLNNQHTKTYLMSIETLLKQLIIHCLSIFFVYDLGSEKVLDLSKILHNEEEQDTKQIFLKYPFLYITHIEIINLLEEKDFDSFIKMITYYDINSYEANMLNNLSIEFINSKIKPIETLDKKIKYEDFNNNKYLELLIQLNKIDKNELISNVIYNSLEKYVNLEKANMGLFNKKKIKANIELKVSLFDEILTQTQIKTLVE